AMFLNLQIELETVLHRLIGFLHQNDYVRHDVLALVPSPGHGLMPYGFAIHVITKGTLVAPVEGFQIQNTGIAVALTFRPEGKVVKAVLAHLADELISFFRPQPLGKTYTLNARIVLLKLYAGDTVVPLCT